VNKLLKKWWWLPLAVLVLLGLGRLRFDVDVLNLLPPDLPSVQGLKLYQEHFANARELIITLRAPSGETTESLAAELATRLCQQTNLVTEVSWQPPWMEHPAQAAEIVAYLWLNQPPEVFNALTNRLSPAHRAAVLGESREALATSLSPIDIARRAFDPYDLLNLPTLANFSGMSADQGQQMFGSSDGSFRLVFLQARPALGGYRACVDWLDAIRRMVEETRAQKSEWRDVTIHYTGRPAFVAEIASSMQRDLSGSIVGTAIIIALLFWLTHRRWLPMLWLLTLLGLILVGTLGLGSLLLGTINVISLGFAAVLLGLAVDYAVVHYQEALAHPKLTVPEIRRAISPSILWAAITTIAAFLMLNFGGLPGLAQLGSLVAIGVSLAALIMVVAFLPPLFPRRRQLPPGSVRPRLSTFLFPPPPKPIVWAGNPPTRYCRIGILVTGLVILAAAVGLLRGLPGVDRSGDALRLQHTEAEVALNEISAAVGIPQDPLWTIAAGKTESEVYDQLARAEALLARASSNHQISGFMIPTPLWPHVANQVDNRPAARWLAGQGAPLREAALSEGFNTNALFLTDELLRTWERLGAGIGVSWPTNQMSRWLLKRFVAHSTNQWLALGLVYPATNQVSETALVQLADDFEKAHISLSGWPLLGTVTLARVKERLWLVVLPMVGLVLISLWLAFRNVREVMLGIAVLLMSGLCLLAFMVLNGWTWNLLNLMALPLILGTGVDYGIFIQLGLRRHGGDVAVVRHSIGRALLLCGGTAIAVFGSLAWSANVGMASLGKVCAIGILANMLISIYLLPAWWCRTMNRTQFPGQGGSPASDLPAKPSALYRAWLWRFGMLMTRVLPLWMLRQFCLVLAGILFRLNRPRREVVVGNLLPVVHGDRMCAEKTARKLYRQFALKLLDLWRFENGLSSSIEFVEDSQNSNAAAAPEQEINPESVSIATLAEAQRKGRGVLLLTPHLGNWEVGALLLKRQGIQLLVITQAEPGVGLTELRQASRARWGIETLVIGNDAFGFVEVIRRLQEGAVIALLVDRPQPSSAVEVELFGRPFRASIAPAELARASGCALFGVNVLRCPDGRYRAQVMREFQYDRKALGSREARHELTTQILRAFEPWIHQYLDQWFHFVPIWPQASFTTAEDGGSQASPGAVTLIP
jgi:uncharacterized protein